MAKWHFFPKRKIHFGWASFHFSNADQDKTSSLILLVRDLWNGRKKTRLSEENPWIVVICSFFSFYMAEIFCEWKRRHCVIAFFGLYLTRLGSYFCQSMSQIFFATEKSTRRFHVLNLICKLIRLKLVGRIWS